MKAEHGVSEERWRGRPFLGAGVRVLIVLVPVAMAVLAALVIAHLLPVPGSGLGIVLWWAAVLGGGLAVVSLLDRAARRFLPLAALLELSLLFPGRAPSRARVAGRTLRGGFERQLRRAVAMSEDETPDRAAEVVLGLLAALTLHDRRTRGHSERVHLFTDLIAEELGLEERDRGRLRWAAMLHDVGKLVVPGDVLNKPAPPDEDEWAVLHRHPEEGARLIAPLKPWLGQWADVVPQHHERWDGQGYPAGLAGDEISLGARIVSVADAYEVMTAARSYRTPVTASAAREELAACAGSQFDPAVVRAFLNVAVARLRWLMGPFAVLAQIPGIRHAAAAGRTQGATMATATAVAGLALMGWFPMPHLSPGPGPDLRVAEAATEEPGGRNGDRGVVDDEQASAAAPPSPTEPDPTPDPPVDDLTPTPSRAGSVPAETAAPGPAPERASAPAEPGAPTGTRGPAPAAPRPRPTEPAAAPAPRPTPGTPPADPPARTEDPGEEPGRAAEPEPEPPAAPARTRAVDDFATTTQGQPVVIDVLANDQADRDAVSFSLIVDPRRGTARINPDRTVTYTPRQQFTGTDRFRYKICGPGAGQCSTATVTVEVRPPGG